MNLWEAARTAIESAENGGCEITHLRIADGKTSITIEPDASWYEAQGWVRADPVEVNCAIAAVLNAALDFDDDDSNQARDVRLTAIRLAVQRYREALAAVTP